MYNMKKDDIRLIASNKGGGDSWVALTPIDLRMPKHQMPMVFAFLTPAPPDFLSRFERGLVKVLLHYPVLAGRVKKDRVHLNNEGVPLIPAKINDASLKEYLSLGFEYLHQLTPSSDDITIPLMIQVTEFSCGCVTVGFARHHNVVDSNAYPIFLSDLAAAVRLDDPVFTLASHDRSGMMPRAPPSPIYDHQEYKTSIYNEAHFKVISSSVHLSAQKLSDLKAECNTGNSGPPYSAFVSLSAFLWKLLTTVRGIKGDTKTVCLCPVDGRRVLGLPPDYFGNVVFRGWGEATAEEILSKPLSFAAGIISSSINKSRSPEYMRSVLDFLALEQQHSASGSSSANKLQGGSIGISPHLVLTSWSRLPIYDIDFGFGTPVKVCPTNLPWEGYVTITPSSKKDGSLDLVANLYEQHLNEFISQVEKVAI